MAYVSRKESLENNYRKVEAMYRRGATFEEIAKGLGLPMMDVLDIVQKIFHLDVKKEAKERYEKRAVL